MTIKAPMMPSRRARRLALEVLLDCERTSTPTQAAFDGSEEGEQGLRQKPILCSELPFILRRGGQSEERQEWESFEFFRRVLGGSLPFPVFPL